MPNRIGRQIPVAGFKPRGLLPDGLLPAARPGGESAEVTAAAAGQVAGAFGQIADEAAKVEGARAGKRAGLETDYRPQGLTTIRGRAFEHAAVQTYLDNLDASLRTDMQALFEQHKDNPKTLKEEFDKLGTLYRSKHVFKDIEGEFNATFARLRLPFQNKALSNHDANVRDAARATLIENVTASQSAAAKMAALDPYNPVTARTVETEIRRIEALYDDAAGKDVITREAAAKLKIANRNSIFGQALLAQADALKTPEEVAAFRANTRKAFGAGALPHLDADGFASVDSQIEKIERGKRTQIGHGEGVLTGHVNDFVQRAVDGFATSPDEWTRLATTDAGRTPRGMRVLALGEAKLKVAEQLRNRSVADGEATVAAMRRKLHEGGAAPSEDAADLVRFAEKLVKDQRTALNTDMLGLAERKRLIPQVAPLDLAGFAAADDPGAAGALGAQVRERVAQARAVGAGFDRAPQFLRPDEVARLKEIVDRGGDKALALTAAIVKGADIDAPAILRELGGDAPLMAQAGLILANGGSLQAARDAFQAAELRADKLRPGDRPAAVFDDVARKELGTAFALMPEDQARVRTAARAISETRLVRSGLDPKTATETYRRAVQEAVGAVFVDGVQYGGVADYRTGWMSRHRVMAPAGVRAERFRDVIGQLRDADLAALEVGPLAASGTKYTARDLMQAVPVAVRGGYRFAMGDPNSDNPRYIRGADGAPFVLPFERLSETLRKRIPAAFLGGR